MKYGIDSLRKVKCRLVDDSRPYQVVCSVLCSDDLLALLPSLQATHRRVCLRRSPALCLTSPASRWIPSPWTTRSEWTRWLWTCWKVT